MFLTLIVIYFGYIGVGVASQLLVMFFENSFNNIRNIKLPWMGLMMNSSVDFLVFSIFTIKSTERARKTRILYFVLSTFASISAI